ncbi:hypothetical protein [Spiroplasma endosymbiont of Tricholauxania praeusta]|uniref:hypothetical protein n=1 Tax=Spiroplasma endosymbiont of Tricholauxania praeusta TaxID=3066296 RepID=UPI0030CF37B9
MNNSTEQSRNETTRLLGANMANTSCLQKDFGCCCITMLSSTLLSTMGLGVGAIYGLIKNNDASNVNSVGVGLFLLGAITGLRCGVTIRNWLINRNNNEQQNNLNIGYDNEEFLQEVTIIDKDARPLVISSNTTKTSKLDNGLIKIEQTFQVEIEKDNEQQFQDGINEYYENEMARKTNDKDCSLKNNIDQKPDFIQIKAEIHSISTNLNDEPSTSTAVIYHL